MCRLAHPRTVAGFSSSAPRSAARSSASGQPRLLRRASSPLSALPAASRPRLVRHPVGAPRRPPRRGLTRRCSGPAVCAGLQCSPGSSPSSVWPAAEHFFVRPRSKQSVLPCACAASPIRGPSRVSAHRPHGPRRGRPLQNRPRLLRRASSPLFPLRSASRPQLVRHPVGVPRRSPRRGLTRRCSGPAGCAGLHCSPGSSPSSVWPAAERSFVRPPPKRAVAQPGPDLLPGTFIVYDLYEAALRNGHTTDRTSGPSRSFRLGASIC